MLNLKIQRRPKWDGSAAARPPGQDPGSVEGGSPGNAHGVSTTPRIKNIIAATDLTAGGKAAVTAGAALAARTGATLSVVSIVELPQCPDMAFEAGHEIVEWVDSRQEEVRRDVELELAGLGNALLHVSAGDPASLVAAFAGSLPSSLVVVGAHRLSRFEKILAGSTGERIIRHSGCPVMVATSDGSGPFKRILVPVDLSRSSQAVLDTAGRLALGDGSEVRVVYSEEPSKSLRRRLTFRNSSRLRQSDRGRLEELVGRSQLPRQTQSIVLQGDAGRAVLQEAREWGADLIVMGARWFKLPFHTRLGRTSRFLLRRGNQSIVVVPT